MSKSSVESSAEAWSENFTEKQMLDFSATLSPVKLNLRPIVIVLVILSCFYLIFFITGMAVAFGKSAKDVKEAITFNKIVNEAIKNCKCIVSDEAWPNCSNQFCTEPTDSTMTINRTRILLHGNLTYCKDYIFEEQQLSCFYKTSQIEELSWTTWSKPNVDNVIYRIRKPKPYSIYYIPYLDSLMANKTK